MVRAVTDGQKNGRESMDTLGTAIKKKLLQIIHVSVSPERVLFGSFITMIVMGTLLLKMPLCTKLGHIDTIDALFTATSAVCVTGLITVDTGGFFSPFGQVVILFLIQAGGLGIITFSTLFYYFIGMDVPMKSKLALESTFSYRPVKNIFSIIKSVFLYAMIFEGIGALVLFLRWLPRYSPGRALYLSVFHSISAFCNAGFSLFSNSLADFRGDWCVNITIMSLIVLGGIGFVVLYEIEHRTISGGRFSLHTKVVLTTTAVLTVISTLLMLTVEWGNNLSAMPPGDKILASLFQSVTARTAGFNTLDIGTLSNTSLFLLILMMFIGASPGSCGGGIKTTNCAILFSLSINRIRGLVNATMFKRTIPQETVIHSVSAVMGSIMFLILMLIVFLTVEEKVISHIVPQHLFLESLFEITSAFGTVGLSMGLTPYLDTLGKLLIIITMFSGRIGLLTLTYALARRRKVIRYLYGEENLIIG